MNEQVRCYLAIFALLLCASCAINANSVSQEAKFVDIDILSTEVSLVVTPESNNITGEQELVFVAMSRGNQLQFDAAPFDIQSAQLNGHPVNIVPETSQTGLSLTHNAPLMEGNEYRLSLSYENSAVRGLTNRATLAASAYFACDWMLCNQGDFSDRFTTKLELSVPANMETLGPGEKIAEFAEPESNRVHHVWQTKTSHPAYIHAFAVGVLEYTNLPSACDTELILLAPEVTDDLRAAFSPTCEMLTFFEQKAGVTFPRTSYSQLYIPESRAAQEAVSHSLVGATFVDPILDDPSKDWVIAHELAHQWWGNAVTAAGLSEFWLNEGMVTFMVAAWKEKKWGRAAYDREIEINKRRWQRRIDESGDPPLAFNGPYPSTGARFSIQYSKGAIFLHELRIHMGDDAFWAGLAEFTQSGFGGAVTSKDFEKAMQAQSQTPLRPLFIQWVYGE